MTNEHETTEDKAAVHKGWGRLWRLMTVSTPRAAVDRALDCARAAGDSAAIAHLEGLVSQ